MQAQAIHPSSAAQSGSRGETATCRWRLLLFDMTLRRSHLSSLQRTYDMLSRSRPLANQKYPSNCASTYPRESRRAQARRHLSAITLTRGLYGPQLASFQKLGSLSSGGSLCHRLRISKFAFCRHSSSGIIQICGVSFVSAHGMLPRDTPKQPRGCRKAKSCPAINVRLIRSSSAVIPICCQRATRRARRAPQHTLPTPQ